MNNTEKYSRDNFSAGLLVKVRENFTAVSLCLLSTVFAGKAEAGGCPKGSPEREAYVAIDASTGQILVEKDSGVKIQPASMTKMMSLLLAHEAMDNHLISRETMISVSEETRTRKDMEHVSGWAGQFKFGDALMAAAMQSYNDLMVTVAENVAKLRKMGKTEAGFVDLMNAKAKDIGMKDTMFYNSTGLPTPIVKVKGQGSTTRDMAVLLKYIADKHPDLMRLFATSEATLMKHKIKNSNTLLHKPDLLIENIAGKTGYTCKAGFAMTTKLEEGGKGVIISYVGGKNAKNREARVLDIAGQATEKIETKPSADKPEKTEISEPQVEKAMPPTPAASI